MRAALRAHPRHAVLAALVAGLLAGPLGAGAVLGAAAGTAAVAGPSVLGAALPAAVLAGALGARARLAATDGRRMRALIGQGLSGRAVLLTAPRPRRFGRAAARVRLLDGPARGEVAVLDMAAGALTAGEVVEITGHVRALRRFEAHHRLQGAHAAIEADATPTGERRGGLAGALDAARDRSGAALTARLPEPHAALLEGMVLGQDERVPDATRTAFERSGLAHVLAVSGQNVVLLCGLVFALGVVADAGLRVRLAASLALVALYVPLAGGGPSIQRAGVMGAAGLVAALAGRPASRWYALLLAAAATLALNPRAAGDPGWQLSFAAVAGLLAVVPGLRQRLGAYLPQVVADAAAVTTAATLATAPLLAVHFEQVSLASLPANLAAAPAVAPAMWLGMLAAAVAQVSGTAGALVATAAGPFVSYVDGVARFAAEAPGAAVAVPLPPAGAAALYAVALGAVGLWRARGRPRAASRVSGPARRAVALGVVAALALAAALLARGPGAAMAPPAPGETVVSFLDVGQGDATLLQQPGVEVLFDTGPPDGPILRRLREAGVERLDALVLTHAQADHEGAALEVVRVHRPRLVLNGGAGWPSPVQAGLPAALRDHGARAVAIRAGQVVRLGGLELRFLWPPPLPPGSRPAGDPNERAAVAHVRAGSFDLLLPADAESAVTAALPLPRVEALKVAHHGSDDAGLAAELARLRPAVAAIEVGRDNAYGHPTPSTLAALGTVPTVVRTDRDGTVRLRVSDGAMRLERPGR